MKCSVIVPVYNTERYLDKCIKSLLNQTIDSIEIILVNDASPDRSIDILRKYEKENKNIIVIDSEQNKRQGGARNLGIDIAKGEYIAFVDSDDWVCESMYEKLYNLAKEEGADIVDCDYSSATETEIVKRHISKSLSDIGIMNKEKYKSAILNISPIWSKIYKRSIFSDNNIRFPEHILYEDIALMALPLMFANKISKVSQHLYYYRVDNISTTRSINNFNYFDRLEASRFFLDLFKKHNLYNTYKEEVDFIFVDFFLTMTIRGCMKRFNPPLPQKIVEIKTEIDSFLPTYKKNKYFKRMKLSRRFRVCRLANFPYLSCKVYQINLGFKKMFLSENFIHNNTQI